MHLASSDMLIFYNNYINRFEHFALLLSAMEEEGIITRDNITFGAKASKIVYDEDLWISSEDETLQTMIITQKDGVEQLHKTDVSIETVVTFKPKDPEHALRILKFLIQRTDATKPNAFDKSWDFPDIRATQALDILLSHDPDFREVVANIHTDISDSQLIIMKQQSKLMGNFDSIKTFADEKLAGFFVSSGVAP